MRVFITGATGFIGQAITAALRERGDTVVALTRSRKKAAGLWPGADASLEIVEGDSSCEGDWQDAVAGCDAVINLAGEPLDGARWDAIYRQKLRDSRIDCTRFLSEAILRADAAHRPKVLVSASGIDYYGFAELEGFDEDEVTESDPGGESFLAALCWDWEDETRPCQEAGVRVARMRTGVVLGARGALPRVSVTNPPEASGGVPGVPGALPSDVLLPSLGWAGLASSSSSLVLGANMREHPVRTTTPIVRGPGPMRIMLACGQSTT